MAYSASVHAKAVELAKLSVEMTSAAGSGHPTSAASLAHIIAVLMYTKMRHDPTQPDHPASDRLVLSEGHAVPIIYAACADLGVYIGKDANNRRPMTREDALTLREMDSVVDGHPNPVEGFPFFDAATGSLGQGLSNAAGIAAAARLDGLDRRVYCIIGDGESREGQIWEAAEFIVDHKLNVVCPIFNCNVYAQSDKVGFAQTAEVTAKKLAAIGYDVKVVDGHNPDELKAAFDAHAETAGNADAAPIAVVANTTKGWGAASMQGHGFHGKPISGDAKDVVFGELDATAAALGADLDPADVAVPAIESDAPAAASIEEAKTFPDALEALGHGDLIGKGKMATRRAYGLALQALGHQRSDVVALDADVKNSTFADYFFKDESLTNRFFECRIAEQNMVSVAAGLAMGGKIPFVSTFAKFLTRAYDQIEMAINSGAGIKVVGSHAGASLGADGPSQMGLPDVAWFRSFATAERDGKPLMYVLQPADGYAAYGLLGKMAEHDGACYMRTLRPDLPFLYDDATKFKLGGHELLQQGSDLLILAAGFMVHQAVAALSKLEEAGIDATLIDVYSIPFDGEVMCQHARENQGRVLTLEDNYGGGLGSAIADELTADGGNFTIKQRYVTQTPKSSKSANTVMEQLGLDVNSIVEAAMNMVRSDDN